MILLRVLCRGTSIRKLGIHAGYFLSLPDREIVAVEFPGALKCKL